MTRRAAVCYSRRRRRLSVGRRRSVAAAGSAQGRLYGLCALCDGYHRQPDLRYRCEKCREDFCLETVRHGAVSGSACPACGAPAEGRDEP